MNIGHSLKLKLTLKKILLKVFNLHIKHIRSYIWLFWIPLETAMLNFGNILSDDSKISVQLKVAASRLQNNKQHGGTGRGGCWEATSFALRRALRHRQRKVIRYKSLKVSVRNRLKSYWALVKFYLLLSDKFISTSRTNLVEACPCCWPGPGDTPIRR